MRSRRSRASWWFVGVAAVMLLVLSWLTVALLQLDHDERHARRQAAVHERLRLALWRMDSWLSPQLAREALRPANDYMSYPTAATAWTKGFSKIGPDEVVVQSPLLGAESPMFPLHFEIGPGGWRSPQVPVGNKRDFAEANGISRPVLERALDGFNRIRRLVSSDALELKIGGALSQLPTLGCNLTTPETPVQAQQSVQELSNRQRAFVSNVASNDGNNYANPGSWLDNKGETVGPMVPVWVDGTEEILLFARRVQRQGQSRVQAVLVDWSVLQQELLVLVEDLFVDDSAMIVRCEAPDLEEQTSMLASVPARIVVDYRGAIAASELPVTTILWTTWGVTLLGLAVLGFTLRAAIGFGERRARFASAVTHELRTPLTTFRMYSEMLADGIVTEPAAQQEYLRTLQRESDRLARVVENVLAWSRLEEGRFAARRERVAVQGLVDRLVPTLAQRLGEVDLTLDARVGDDARAAIVDTDEDAVGQILFNLIDNAAKYARDADDKSVSLRVHVVAGSVHLTVCDHGPGIDDAHRSRVFVPFDRGAVASSSNDVPGVGLGLPLARGLARDLGGDLRLERNEGGGACFVLELPVV